MNNFNMALSLMDNINTVSVIFANSTTDLNIDRLDATMKQYTYYYDSDKLELTVGDRVVVDGSNKFQVVTVVDVHKHAQLDINVGYNYKGIVARFTVDKSVEEKAEQIVTLLGEAQRRDARAKLIEEFAGALTEETIGEFKMLGIDLAKDES